jgi:ABC-type bacteriocin/lantibiotic exporter with double-glycine peptidase domain
MASDKNKFSKLFELIKLEGKEISAIYFYAILSGLIQLSLPLGIQAILGFVLGATMATSVYLLIGAIIIAVLFVGYFQIQQMKIIEKIQQKIFVRYAFAFAESIPRFNLKDIDKYYLPEKINRFFDTLNVQKGISKLLLDIPIAIIQIVFGLVLLSLYHPLFVVFSFILILIIYLIFKLTSRRGLDTSIAESNHKYAVVAWLEEMGRVIKSLKYSQGTNINLIETDEKLLKYIGSRTSHFKILLLQFKSLVFFKVSVTALMLILGTYLLFNQQINIGQFVAAEIVIITVINSLEKLITSLENIYDVITGLYKLDSVLDNTLEKDGTISLAAHAPIIEIHNLSFTYNNAQKVFDEISFPILPNSITCISGEENSGKSTLLKLLTGSYADFEGSIQFNKIPLQNYSLQSLRSQTGIMLYEQDIFEGTLYNNITLGKTIISPEQIIDLLITIGIDNFISFFPKSFETIIDPLGKTLPSSVVQKILLLRALINNPSFLILEEPWQNLDSKSTSKLQQYLIDNVQNKTIIVSTNNKIFIDLCAHHIHLQNGKAQILK